MLFFSLYDLEKYFSLCSNKTQSSNEEKPWIKFHVTLDKIPTWKNHTAGNLLPHLFGDYFIKC